MNEEMRMNGRCEEGPDPFTEGSASSVPGPQAAETEVSLGTDGEGAALPEPAAEELALWEEMLQAYPEADAPEKLPKGVIEAIAAGKRPLVAMHEAEIARLRGVISAYEQREKAAKSCGSVSGTAAPASDPVLEILLGE